MNNPLEKRQRQNQLRYAALVRFSVQRDLSGDETAELERLISALEISMREAEHGPGIYRNFHWHCKAMRDVMEIESRRLSTDDEKAGEKEIAALKSEVEKIEPEFRRIEAAYKAATGNLDTSERVLQSRREASGKVPGELSRMAVTWPLLFAPPEPEPVAAKSIQSDRPGAAPMPSTTIIGGGAPGGVSVGWNVGGIGMQQSGGVGVAAEPIRLADLENATVNTTAQQDAPVSEFVKERVAALAAK